MPAFVEIDYTDDGCYIWICSECNGSIEARGNYNSFRLCPYCGIEFTHSWEANCPEALQIRDRRRTDPWEEKQKTYWLKIVRVNFHKRPSKPSGFDCITLMTGNTQSTWGGDLKSFFGMGEMVTWYKLSDYPPHLKTEYYDGLSRDRLIQLIKYNRANPKWFGIGQPKDRKQIFYGSPGIGKTEFIGG